MAPPSDHVYNEMYWDDMPEAAHQAAQTWGYDKETWDADAAVPYQTKAFTDCSAAEKQAAMFLNMSPMAAKLNVWWEDLEDAVTQKHAMTLGWTPELWDADYELEDLEIEQKYWSELNAQQQEAAAYFGYTKATWDETWNAEDFHVISSGGAKPTAQPGGAGKMFTPPPKGKIFGKKQEDADEKKEEEHHRFGLKPDGLIKPFEKLFGKDDHDDGK